MKAILFSGDFEAPNELVEFCKSIGYEIPNNYDLFGNYIPEFCQNYDLMFDNRVIEFCEQRLSPLWEERVYKGKESNMFRIGFAGAGYIRDIDTSRSWIIKYNYVDAPIIQYINVEVNDYGLVSIVKEKEK